MSNEHKFAPGPWEYNDPSKFQQPLGKFSYVAVYAAGNAFPWRMAEIQGPDEATEIATARLIAAAPDMLAAIEKTIRGLEGEFGSRRAEVNFPELYEALAKAVRP